MPEQKRLRSKRTYGVELDNVLLAIQGEGHHVHQVCPFPTGLGMEESKRGLWERLTGRGSKLKTELTMEFMVIYIETVDAKLED